MNVRTSEKQAGEKPAGEKPGDLFDNPLGTDGFEFVEFT